MTQKDFVTFSLHKRGFATILIFVLVALMLVGVGVGGWYWYQSHPSSAPTPNQSTYQRNELKATLTFISAEDKQKLHQAIDDSKDLKDFEHRYYNTFADILEQAGFDYLLGAPEIYAQPLETISINDQNPLGDMQFIFLTEADLSTLKSFAHILTDEYTKYPLGWMEQINPLGFIFVKKVVYQESEEAGGVTNQLIAYDISSNDKYQNRLLIHHEIAHFMQQRNFPETFSGSNWPSEESLYRQSYNLQAEENFSEHPLSGFVTEYARINSTEDQAEVYSYLFTGEGHKKLTEWTKNDELLRKKADYLKRFIRSKAPGIDDAYYTKYVLN